MYEITSTNQEIRMRKTKIWYYRQATKPTFQVEDEKKGKQKR
jgi:hypothetical protein